MTGCSNKKDNLNSADALGIIAKEYVENCRSTVKYSISRTVDGSKYQLLRDNYKDLEEKGLAQVTRSNRNGYDSQKIKFTNMARNRYDAANRMAIVTEFIPKEIIGVSISEDGKRAEVIFKGKFMPTPFYGIRGYNSSCKLESGERTVTLVKYDTGWRLQK